MDDGSLAALVPILMLAASIVLYVVIMRSNKNKLTTARQTLQNQLQNIRGFTPTQTVVSINGKTALGVDEHRNLICLLSIDREANAAYRILPVNELISVEIFVGTKSTSQVRNSAIKGAVVGSVFGGVGALIGAKVAGSKAAADVNNISLVLTINDTQSPYHHIYFRTPAKKNTRAMEGARQWMAILEILIKRAESGQIAPPSSPEWMIDQGEVEIVEKTPQLPSPRPESSQPPICELRSASSPNSYPIRVDQETFTIGRAMTNDLILQDSTVSRQHAVLRFLNNRWVIQDQNSTGGVYINGNRAKEKRLRDGDQIQIGSAVFIYRSM
jgi:hypothetical protein